MPAASTSSHPSASPRPGWRSRLRARSEGLHRSQDARAIWRAAAWGALAAGIVMAGLPLLIAALGASATDVAGIGHAAWRLGVLAVVTCLLVVAGRLLFSLPVAFLCAVAVAVATAVPLLSFLATRNGAIQVTLACALATAAVAGGTRWLVRARRRRHRPGVLVAMGLVLAGAGTLAFAVWWLADAGRPGSPDAGDWARGATALAAPDPFAAGQWSHTVLTYGSGQDRRRPEYGQDADLEAPTVDASRLLDWGDGAPARIRAAYWGIDPGHLPLQGRIWLPDGEGSFPLVLIVHGNHLMDSFSDPGYAWLGERLASRGYIAVSVDQNFLNSGVADLTQGGTSGETQTRAWLMLEHLRLWHRWNASPGHPLAGRVDTGRIALIGHSRGGEAVAIAAAFNRLPAYPDDATFAFDYGYDIRAIVALSPTDGQYRPGRRGPPLRDIDYLTLQGGQDADMFSFDGVRQFDRIAYSPGGTGFRSAVHFAGGNHGQFNTVWGRYDMPRPLGWLLNLAPLMPGERQRHIAGTFVGAFLEASLRDDARYRPLFHDPRTGAAWLPEGVYNTEYVAAGDMPLATFDEDLDPTTASLPGVRLSQHRLTDWREQRIQLRRGLRDTSAVWLGWRGIADPAHFALRLPDGLPTADALSFAMADTGATPRRTPDTDASDAPDAGDPDAPLDLSVRVTDRSGQTATLPLGRYGALQRVQQPDLFKAAWVRGQVRPEPLFRTWILPLRDFVAENPTFDPGALQEIAFVFDRSPQGVVALSRVALVPASGIDAVGSSDVPGPARGP